MSEINVTVNTYPASSFGVSAWNIRDKNDEPERVSVRKGDREYSIVFSKPIRVEVWSVDDRGELSERLYILDRPIVAEEDDFFGPEFRQHT